MRHLKLFLACMLLTVFSIGQVWADSPATITFGSLNLTNDHQYSDPFEIDDNVTITFGGGSNDGKYYTTGSGIRTYGGGTITVDAGSNTISEIEFTWSGSSYKPTADVASPTGYSTSTNKWTGSASAVTLTRPSGSGHWRLQIVKVTYSTSGGSDPSLSVSPKTIDFGIVEQGATVSAEDVTVTFANLTGSVTYTGLSGAFSATGSISSTGDKITITPSTATIGEYEQTLTVQSTADSKSANVTVTMKVVEPFNGLVLTFPDYNDTGVGSYTASWTATKSGQVWNFTNFNNNNNGWALIKAGRNNNNTSIATITTQVENHAVSEVTVTVASVTASNINSHKLCVADNASFNDAIEILGIPVTMATGDVVYTVPVDNRDNDLYYKLVYDCKAGSSNGFLQISKITYAYAAATPQKTPAGLAYDAADAQKLAKLGGSFTAPILTNPHSLNVSYASDNTDVAEVASDGSITIKAAGKAEITASYVGDDTYKAGSATYTIFVATEAGTAADPLTEASAKTLIDNGCTLTVHVNGLVLSQNSTNFTVTLTNGFQFYKAKDLNNVAFESAYLGAGDEVTAVGALKKYSSTYELDEGCYLTFYQQATTPLTPIANDKDHPYSVATALGYAAAPTTYDLSDHVYIQGVVYKVNSFNTTNGTYNIYIKDAGTSEDDGKFEFFKCSGLYQVGETVVPFAEGDVQEGDEVIGYGVMTYYTDGSIWEFGQPNQLVYLNRPAVAVTGVTVESTASVAVGGHVTLHASVVPANASNKTINWSVQSGNAYASVQDGVVTGIAEGTAVIRAASDADATKYAECTVTVAPLSPWATVYTSNITLSTEGGTSASVAKVKFDGEDTEYDAIKAGTGSVQGAIVVNVPAGATALHFHAYSWNTEDVELTVTAPAGVMVTPATAIAINKNAGISGNSPFTLEAGSTPQYDAYYAVSLSGNTTAADITITATSGKRFVLFGVNQEGAVTLESIAVGGTATALEYNDGDHFNPAGLTVTGTYSDASTAPITEGITWNADPDPLTEGTTSVSVTATVGQFTSTPVVINGLTVHGAAPLSPWATTYTSNLADITGAKVKFFGETTEYDAIKAGTGSVAGEATINIPAGATELHLHAYGWKGETVTLSITAPAGVTVTPSSIELNANTGITSNSPFTLAEGSTPQTDAYYALSLSGNTDAIELTITATAGKRFVLFGVNQEGGVVPVLQSIAIAGDMTNKTYKAGDQLNMAGLTVSATYTLGGVAQTPVDITDDPNLTWTYDPIEENQTSVDVTANFEGKTDTKTITGLEVASADPKIYVSSTKAEFGTVAPNATVDPIAITVTLTNVAAATAALGGTNPTAFSIDKTALTASGDITISVVSTATVGEFKATLTISDDASQADSKTINISLKVEDAETPVATTSKWVAATEITDGMQVLITGVKSDVTYAMSTSSSNGNNRTSVAGTLNEGVFTPGENTMPFTLVATGATNTYYIMTSNNQYLYNASTSGSNAKSYLKTKTAQEDVSWTITLDADGNAVITSVENTNRQLMRFNNGGSNALFNCYASGQAAIKLYVPQTTPPTPTKDVIRDNLTNGKWGTICPKQTVENVEGAKFYQISYLEEQNGVPFNMVWDEISGTTLIAGQPYFFIANATEIRGNKTSTVATSGSHVNGFYGYIGDEYLDLPNWHINYEPGNDNTFVIYNNKVTRIDGATQIYSERCYININATEPTRQVKPQQSAALHRVMMSISGADAPAVTTGINEITNDQMTNKVIINGHLFIKRGEKLYDATGRLVK